MIVTANDLHTRLTDFVYDAPCRCQFKDGLVLAERCERCRLIFELTDLRSHEPPRNSGEGTAVNGPMPLAGGDDANASA